MSRRRRRTRAKTIRHAGPKRGPLTRGAPSAAATAIALAGPFAAGATAGEIDAVELVRDINQTPDVLSGSSPSDLTNVNGTLFFSATEGVNGEELWKSDGSSATQVADIHPGPLDSYVGYLTNVNGTLFFRADDGTNGLELWKSDGSTATQVANINPGAVLGNPGFGLGSSPFSLTNVSGTLFFSADDGTNGLELWKSDGSSATQVANIKPGALSSYPYGFTNVNGTLFFAADDGTNGSELWKSDGSGATQVANINPGAGAGSYPGHLTNVNGTLFFRANDGTNGTELWKSDGSTATQVADIRTGPGGSYPGPSTNVNGTLFFSANDGTSGYELWKSDGASATQVADIQPGVASGDPAVLTNVNGRLFFAANDGTTGAELWKSDGSTAVQVEDIKVGAAGSYPNYLTSAGGTLFFNANDGAGGYELWKSDGASATQVGDIGPGIASGGPGGLTSVAGSVFFSANDGTSGGELWRATDATAPDTTITSGPAEGSTIMAASATFAFAGIDADTAKLQCSLDGAAFADCSSPHTFSGLGDGSHTAAFRAVDDFGNTDASPATRTFTVDTTLPSNEFTLPRKGKNNLRKGTLKLEIDLPGPGTIGAAQTRSGSRPRILHPRAGGRTLIKKITKDVAAAGPNKIKIKPTKAGLKALEKALARAEDKGDDVGILKVPIAFTFTPAGGDPNTESRAYKLKLE